MLSSHKSSDVHSFYYYTSWRNDFTILGVFAEFERERNAERVKDNMIHMAKFMDQRKGKTIARTCYGFDIDKEYVVNSVESTVV
ncbi:recombinase family protein [Brevibacterium sp. JNUCC-42]|nr:recombinase family protein [Brevibacterium sp. JNUCC-42]